MKVAIVGLGASGLMASAIASKHDEVHIFEKNEKAGKKIFITGKGRCNMTNACDIFEFKNNIVRNSKFLSHALSVFNNQDIIDFFESNGLKTKVERGNRVYPKDDKAYLVTDCFMNIIKKNNAKIFFNTEVTEILTNGDKVVGIKVKDSKSNKINEYSFDKVIVCTGGMSYKSTGSTGDGYRFAKDLNINTTKLYPSLIPFKVKQNDELKHLEGLNLRNVSIKISNKDNKVLYKDFGEMMFRDSCLDGPIILSASAYVVDKLDEKLTIHIDLKPSLDYQKLEQRILRDVKDNNKYTIKEELLSLLPSQMIDVFANRVINSLDDSIDLDSVYNKSISNLSKKERNAIINTLKDYSFEIIDTKNFDSAIVTKGGIDIKEIDAKTMQSKKINDLYFAGEVMDIDALTGGFNLSIAFITGYIAGQLL